MSEVTLCRLIELPEPGRLREYTAAGRSICVANRDGAYVAMDNICPHRGGPLAEGTLEEGKVLCPWHAWAFDLDTGVADHDPSQRVAKYPLRASGEWMMMVPGN